LPVPPGKDQGSAKDQRRRQHDRSFHTFLLELIGRRDRRQDGPEQVRGYYTSPLKNLSNFFRHFLPNVNIFAKGQQFPVRKAFAVPHPASISAGLSTGPGGPAGNSDSFLVFLEEISQKPK
jgi:hypothetical protein